MNGPYKHNGKPARPVGRATHHILVDTERLVLAGAPLAGAPPDLDEVVAGALCGDCGRDIFAALQWDASKERFVCECGTQYALHEGGYLFERGREEDDR